MSTDERRPLLPRNTGRLNRPAPPSRSGTRASTSVPSIRRVGGDEVFGVSPGGQSWHRKV